jgi:uncharacterized protein YdgA (DUF945 family)
MKNAKIIAVVAVVFVIALGAMYFVGKKNAETIHEPTAQQKKEATEQVKKFWGQEQKQLRKM